jgi:hypothetical protein
MTARTLAAILFAGAVSCGIASPSPALVLGDGRGKPDSDCLAPLSN